MTMRLRDGSLKKQLLQMFQGIGLPGASRNEIIFILEKTNYEQNVLNDGLKIANGVLFVSKDVPNLVSIGEVSESISRQNATLIQLRELMAFKARGLGANTIYRFQNSQSAHGPLKLLNPIRWDTESLGARGELAFVEPAEMENFLLEISKSDSIS